MKLLMNVLVLSIDAYLKYLAFRLMFFLISRELLRTNPLSFCLKCHSSILSVPVWEIVFKSN